MHFKSFFSVQHAKDNITNELFRVWLVHVRMSTTALSYETRVIFHNEVAPQMDCVFTTISSH